MMRLVMTKGAQAVSGAGHPRSFAQSAADGNLWREPAPEGPPGSLAAVWLASSGVSRYGQWMPSLILPRRGSLGPNNQDDPHRYYYMPLVSRLFVGRIDLGLRLLDGLQRPHAALELGYGSGLLLPTLCKLADEVSAIDLNSDPDQVRRQLAALGAHPKELRRCGADELPFPDRSFDLVVSFSLLEHLPEPVLDRTLAEAARVLRPGGHLLVGCPAVHRGMNLLFSAIGFPNIDDHHVSDIHAVLRLCQGRFERLRTATLPGVLPLGWAPYGAVLLRRLP